MIGQLPTSLIVKDKKRAIRCDYRTALIIFQALNDTVLNEYEKTVVLLECLYKDFKNIDKEDYKEALNQAVGFLNGGKENKDSNNKTKVLDWEQDEQLIFSAVNKVAGFEIRCRKNLHWWTFLGYFNEIGEGLFSTVMHIRNKKSKGKKLDKTEQEFYKNNKELIDLKKKYTIEEQKEIDRLNDLLK